MRFDRLSSEYSLEKFPVVRFDRFLSEYSLEKRQLPLEKKCQSCPGGSVEVRPVPRSVQHITCKW